MLEEVEVYVYDRYIKKMVIEEDGVKKIFKEELDKLNLSLQEKNFIVYIINKNNIKLCNEKIKKEDRSSYVRDNDYGDIKGHGLEKLDEPVMSKIEYSSSNDKVYEDYSELDEYLETRFIPTYISLKKRKNAEGELEYFTSIGLYHIVALKLSEAEFEHVMNYLKERNIRVGGKDSTLDGEFKNYDYKTTYKEKALPLSVPTSITLQKIRLYKQTGDQKIREEIITDNLRLVPYVTYRYAIATGINQHELESYGYEGLIVALEKFDTSFGIAFSTYAVAYIRGYFLSGIEETLVGKRDNFYYDYVSAKKAIEKEWGVSLSEASELIEDVIDLLVVTGKIKDDDKSKKTARMRIMAYAVDNASLSDEEEVEELIADGQLIDSRDYEDEILSATLKPIFKQVLDSLPEREAEVIKLRYGFYDGEEKTVTEVAKLLGLTYQEVLLAENKAMRCLRHPRMAKLIRDYYDNPSDRGYSR